MSRYQKAAKTQPEKTKYSQSQLRTITSVSNLLSNFIAGHQKNSISSSWKKVLLYAKIKKRSSNFFSNKLNNFANRKNNQYLRWSFKNLCS